MAEANILPEIDEAKLKTFGQRLYGEFEKYEQEKKPVEEKHLKNLRQFRGVYDPEVEQMLGKNQSRAYPKLTRWIIVGTVARLMQMLFPQGEKNFAVNASPMPDLSVAQLQEVLDKLQQEKAAAGKDPRCTDEEIEKAILEFAKGKAERMELKCSDDLAEIDYPALARRVIFSAALYNIGILKGPLHVKKKARTWNYNEFSGKYEAKEVEKFKPIFEFVPVWSYYPDMTATALDKQDGEFEMHIMTRQQVEELAGRPDFMGEPIRAWLTTHLNGNHKVRHWESAMKGEKKSDRQAAQDDQRKYEVLSYWGAVTGHEVAACGVAIAEKDLHKTYMASVWMIDNVVIKCKPAPLPDCAHYHKFIFEEDDLSLMGNGQSDTVRDTQLGLAECVRAALDNMSVCGTDMELNTDLLTPGQDLTKKKNQVYLREGEGAAAQIPAVRGIEVPTHLDKLLPLIEFFLMLGGKESGLPAPSMGDVQQGGSEALRTTQNASMFLGAAALPIRDTVRNFDAFTKSVITSLVKWNMKYDANPSRDGDFDVIARGSTSLIAKEVLSQSLDLFKATLTEDEIPHVKTRKLLEQRMKARDLPVDEILEDEDVALQTIERIQAQQQAQVQQQTDLVQAQVQQTMADAFKKVKDAMTAEGKLTVDSFTALIEGLANGGTQGKSAQAGTRSTSTAS